MDNPELDKLLLDIRELKQSVHKANPFLRDIMALRAYALMSFPLGILLLADCLAAHILARSSGSFKAIPQPWKILCLSLFALIAVVGSVAKWIVVVRRAAQLRDGATMFSVLKAIYGGNWFSIFGPLSLSMVLGSLFVAWAGHPWLIPSVIAVFLGPICTSVAMLLDRKEYLSTGWYLTLAGLLSFFFIQSEPFIWLAAVWAGTFLVFGWAGLAASRRDSEENP